MTSLVGRTRCFCIYILSLVYRWKWIRYTFITAILCLIVLGVSITELRHRRYMIFSKHDNVRNSVIFTGENIDNGNYRVDVRVGEAKSRHPLAGKKFIGGDGYRDQPTDTEVDKPSFIGLEAFSNEGTPSFIDGTRKEKSNSNNRFTDRERDIVIPRNDNYFVMQREFQRVHRKLKHANDLDIVPRGRTNDILVSHLLPNKESVGSVFNLSSVVDFISPNGVHRKLKTVNSDNESVRRMTSSTTPSHNSRGDQVRTKNNQFESAVPTLSPLDNSYPPIQSTESTTNYKSTAKKCTPVENVIFLKTHKTGSSTIINIMQRYAHTHNLKVALPNISHFLGWPNTFREKYVFEHSKGDKYNILCNHARFHKERMLDIMQSKNTKIVTIIRDPLYQFESTAVYLNFYALFKINRKQNLLDAFFNKSKMEIYNRTKHRNTHNIFLVKNPVTYDLGHPTWKDNERIVERILRKVKNDFHLVMISDYMAESLQMLKEELCWDLKDIVYFTMNKRPDKLRQQIPNINKARKNVNNWNNIDSRIFEYYNKTFWERVRKGGTEFQENVKRLKETNDWLRRMCLQPGRHFDKSQPWFPILGFKLKNESKNFKFRTLCENMIRSEIDYTNLMKLSQTKYNWTIPTNPPKKKKKPRKLKSKTVQENLPIQKATNTKGDNYISSNVSRERSPDTG